MPRVHGVDIVPRRRGGRGGGGRGTGGARRTTRPSPSSSSPSSSSGFEFGEAAASASAPSRAACVDVAPAASASSSSAAPNNADGGDPLPAATANRDDDDVGDGDDGAKTEESNGGGGNACGCGGPDEGKGGFRVTAASSPDGRDATKNPTAASVATTAIRPRTRESISDLDFGSRSFSVQSISRRATTQFRPGGAIDGAKKDYCDDATGLGFYSLGLRAPSSLIDGRGLRRKPEGAAHGDGRSDGPRRTSAASSESAQIVGEPPPKDGSGGGRSSACARRQRKSSPPTDDGTNDDVGGGDEGERRDNARWLYERCASARVAMESSSTALQLAMAALRVVKSSVPTGGRVDGTNGGGGSSSNDNNNNNNDDDGRNDDASEEGDVDVQGRLFEMLTGEGKRRDIDFVFDVSGRAGDLRDDATLDEARLREPWLSTGSYNHMGRMLVPAMHSACFTQQ